MRLQSRFTARKKDKHHNNINTSKCETEDSINNRESETLRKGVAKNKVDDRKSWKKALRKLQDTHTHTHTGEGHVIASHLCKVGRGTERFSLIGFRESLILLTPRFHTSWLLNCKIINLFVLSKQANKQQTNKKTELGEPGKAAAKEILLLICQAFYFNLILFYFILFYFILFYFMSGTPLGTENALTKYYLGSLRFHNIVGKTE